ncbi:MAG: signal recognition particle-docking protein FtsY [Lachnospiraceae bacterium]|nr:signal recognition particle-docking protein FtsY [Lachnospiraceae bacterium]
MSFFKKIFGDKNNNNDFKEEDKNTEELPFDSNLDSNIEEEASESETKSLSSYEEEEIEDLEEIEEAIETEEPKEENASKKGFFQKMFEGLDKTRKNILGGVENVLSVFTVIDDELFDELEEALILADIGVETSMSIIEELRTKAKKNRITDVESLKTLLIEEITEILKKDEEPLNLSSPSVMLVIGVNGVGKTTTIGKLTNKYKREGKKVVLAAADTFRAAAIDQLEIWANRNSVDIIKHQENSDPAAVIFDGIKAAKSRNTDLLICDTAGRLHNKKNLMEELKKIYRVIEREYPEAHQEVLLVLDATTGQNALQQAKIFKEAANITGIVLTKLDGTAKGGIIIAIKNELNVPVRYIGVGEAIDDLQPFNAEEFSKALFGIKQ